MARHYYRCADCLSVCAADTNTGYYDNGYRRYGKCGACDGWMEYMGRVEADRLVKTELLCPCDGRCTSALGPSCNCRCGGANHGSNMVVPVTVDQGGIPVLAIADPKVVFKVKEYRELLQAVRDAIKARYGRVIDAKRRGEYVSREDFYSYLDGTRYQRMMNEAKELRTHAGRNRKLKALLDQINGVRKAA